MRSTRIITVSLLFIVTNAAWGQSGWTNQIPSSEFPGMFGICAIDSAHVWAVGYNYDYDKEIADERVIRSTNGGESWDVINTGFHERLTGVVFINRDTGFIYGQAADEDPFIIRTLDAGLNWQRLELQASVTTTVNEIDYFHSQSKDSIFMFAAGGLGHVWRSKDLGDSWSVLSGGCRNGNFNACSMINEDTCWFVGTPDAQSNNSIMVTLNGGVDFCEQTNPTRIKLNEVSFINAHKGIAVGNAYTILFTDDGGDTWENITNKGYRWQAVELRKSGNAWAVGNDGIISYSRDYGYTWKAQESGMDGYELWDVSFVSDNEGWIAGGGIGYPGIILHTATGGEGTTGVDPVNRNKACSLGQNYPNPVIHTTRISYQVQHPGRITIMLYDVLGNKLEYLVNEYKSKGDYTIDFATDHYPRGIYFYGMKAGSEWIQTRRMMILK